MIALVGHYNEAFLAARPFVRDVVGDDALFAAGAFDVAWDAAWDDLFDCWCGCPL